MPISDLSDYLIIYFKYITTQDKFKQNFYNYEKILTKISILIKMACILK